MSLASQALDAMQNVLASEDSHPNGNGDDKGNGDGKGNGDDKDMEKCPTCKGTGKVDDKTCPTCKGTGEVKADKDNGDDDKGGDGDKGELFIDERTRQEKKSGLSSLMKSATAGKRSRN